MAAWTLGWPDGSGCDTDLGEAASGRGKGGGGGCGGEGVNAAGGGAVAGGGFLILILQRISEQIGHLELT